MFTWCPPARNLASVPCPVMKTITRNQRGVTRTLTTRKTLATGVAAAVFFLGACSPKSDPTATATGDAPAADTTVSGKIVISGSSTVEPITAMAREAFIAQNDKVAIDVDGPGTGDGFKLFCAGDTDISDASRPIKPEEAETCADNGIEYIELEIAIDGISVIAPESNELACLTFADLYALTGPESEGKTTWAATQPIATELGSTTTFPDSKLVITAPGTESGTYDSFVELVVDKVGEQRVEAGKITEDDLGGTRADYSASPDDNAIIEAVSGDPGGLGWVGFAYADQADGIRTMPIATEPGGPCVEPTAETIQDGTYPISRSLYLYVSVASVEKNKAVAAFVDFTLAGLHDFVAGADYVPLDDLTATETIWKDRTTGTHVGD